MESARTCFEYVILRSVKVEAREAHGHTLVVSVTVLPTPFVAPPRVSVRPVTVPPRVLPRPLTER